MRIAVATANTVLIEGPRPGDVYRRGEVYTVADDVGQRLLATGRFCLATLPPPDPAAAAKDRAQRLIDALAALGEDALGRLERLAGLVVAEEAATGARDDLEALTVADLQAIAEVEGVDLAGLRRKAEILSAIRAARDEG